VSHILIVDDQEFMLSLLTDMLRDRCRLSSASSGAQALDALRTQLVDLLIIDQSLPDMPGMQVIEHMRASGSQIPLVLLTGYGVSMTQEATWKQLGMTALLMKPVTLTRLDVILGACLESAPGGPK
jgi:CheY-like chemotaxis protein